MLWRMRPGTRRLVLLLHVITSVGWIGVEVSILACGVVGLLDPDPIVMRSTRVVAGVLGGIFYFPASLVTLVTGLLLSWGTRWGVLRYRWVVLKLVLNLVLFAGGNLAVIPSFESASRAAAQGLAIGTVGVRMVTAMAAGLILLLVATHLSVYKPWGRTRWYRRSGPASSQGG
jgi:hypothetical protein